MQRLFYGFLIAGILASTIAVAEDSSEELVKKYHKQIEGTWRAISLEVNGNKGDEADTRKITVVNGNDGSWSVRLEDKEIAKGTSVVYPTQKPQTIDFTPTEGDAKGQVHLGIYVLEEKTRKLCFAPAGKPRPTEFASAAGSENILITFEREKAK